MRQCRIHQVLASYTTAATAGDLLVVVCSSGGAGTFSITQAGFTAAKNESSTASQAMFYKIAAGGETTITCNTTGSTMPMSVQVFEYSGIENTNLVDAVNTTTSTGTGTALSSGSLSSLNSNDLLFAAVTTTNTSSAVSFTPQ